MGQKLHSWREVVWWLLKRAADELDEGEFFPLWLYVLSLRGPDAEAKHSKMLFTAFLRGEADWAADVEFLNEWLKNYDDEELIDAVIDEIEEMGKGFRHFIDHVWDGFIVLSEYYKQKRHPLAGEIRKMDECVHRISMICKDTENNEELRKLLREYLKELRKVVSWAYGEK